MTKVCQPEDIEAPWLQSMGYTYKMERPTWLDPRYKFKLPAGGGITFYCANNWQRPKKDVWDDDDSDGLIQGYCSHEGQVSMAMTPSSMSIIDLCSYKPAKNAHLARIPARQRCARMEPPYQESCIDHTDQSLTLKASGASGVLLS